jgi:dTDP-4-amino-4,6-dideoxygalactose transaminase
MSKLAINGGKPTITRKQPHYVWPPQASLRELRQIAKQRNEDIVIKGNAGPIGELERKFKKFLDNQVAYAVAFNAGTTALLAAYIAVGIEAGDEIIVPAITYHAAVTPLFMLRAKPVVVDVDAESWCIDPKQIKKAITSKTKAITVVHQWGHPANMDAITKIAQKHGLKIIEDCSHAHGSRYKNQPVGTFGDVAVFSLQANKLVFAGEGGMLVTNTKEVYERALLVGHYRDRARDDIQDYFYQQFWVTGYGLKLRMSPFNAIVALHSLFAAKERIKQRQKCLSYFREQLNQLPELSLPVPTSEYDMGAWYGFKPIYSAKKLHQISREKYIAALQAEGVVIKAPSSPAFSYLPLFQIKDDKLFSKNNKQTYQPGDFPVAEKLSATAVSLPTFTRWSIDKPVIDQYLQAMRKVQQHAQELI